MKIISILCFTTDVAHVMAYCVLTPCIIICCDIPEERAASKLSMTA